MLYRHYLKKCIEKNRTYCLFCSDISERIIAKNKYAFLTYSLAPYHKYHLLVIPFRHTKAFLDLTKLEIKHIDDMLRRSVKLIHTLGYENCSILMRDSNVKDKSIEHLHYHIVPNTRLGDLDHNSDERKIVANTEIKKLLKDFNNLKTN